jgi:hypothetical protein
MAFLSPARSHDVSKLEAPLVTQVASLDLEGQVVECDPHRVERSPLD